MCCLQSSYESFWRQTQFYPTYFNEEGSVIVKKPIIQFKDFTFQYRAQVEPTLKNINLTIYAGEKVMIVGASGSGKSTLAYCINGLAPNHYEGNITGHLFIKGKEIKNHSIYQLSSSIGTVLQDPDSQFIGLTVAEDIAFSLENDCTLQPAMKEKVKNIAHVVDIHNHLLSSPHELSGGQKQRVALAGVLVDNIDILLFDEPLANIDPATGKTSIELIDDLHRKGDKTIIIIEHRLEDVLHRNVDRIIVIHEGQIYADGTPLELLKTNTLAECGIREPLYLTALKYANCDINKSLQLQQVEALRLDAHKKKLQEWHETNSVVQRNKPLEPILELQDIHFSYSKNKKVFENLSFTIHKGEMISIVGKNGIGKSTISKLICGVHQPTHGSILFRNKNMQNLSIKERASHVGIVMQNPNQMISKTFVVEEVALGLKLRGRTEEEIQKIVYQTLKLCGLYEFRNWPISALSFGQKKRVTIAAILALQPEILIMDEPTAGQDFKHYTEIMEFLQQLNDQGITIIMITHDMHVMLEYTNRTIVLAKGRVFADDTPTNILTNTEIVETAHLKVTSLFTLAQRAGINNPQKFVDFFIAYDRRIRNEKKHVNIH